jgi:hypothetical protein
MNAILSWNGWASCFSPFFTFLHLSSALEIVLLGVAQNANKQHENWHPWIAWAENTRNTTWDDVEMIGL